MTNGGDSLKFERNEWLKMAGMVGVSMLAVLTAGLWMGGIFAHVYGRPEIHQTHATQLEALRPELARMRNEVVTLMEAHLQSMQALMVAHRDGGPHPEAVELFHELTGDLTRLRERVAIQEARP